MKHRPILLLSLLAAGTLSAGIAEDFPDFFPKSEPPAAENGYPALRRLVFNKKDGRALPRIEPDDATWLLAQDADAVAAMVHRNAAMLESLEKVMASKSLYNDRWKTPDSDSEFLAILPASDGLRLMMLRDAVAARDDGGVKQAVETVLRCAGFSLRICEAEPLLVEALVGSYTLKSAIRHLPVLLALPQATPEILQETDKQLFKMDRAGEVMRSVIPGEARWSLHYWAKLTKNPDSRRDFFFETAVSQRATAEFLGKAPKTETASAKETPGDAIRRAWKKSLPQEVTDALQAAEKVDWKAYLRDRADWFRALRKADTASVPAFRASFHPVGMGHYVKGTALEPLFTSLLEIKIEDSYMRLCASTTSAIRLARVAIWLRQYELKNKKLPAALTDLVPDYCPAIPLDPFDGKPVRYDADAKKVWCVGLNLKDEKGDTATGTVSTADDEMLAVP